VARVSAYLNAERVSLDQAMKIQGMLEHVTFILTAGSSYLPSLSWAIKSFKGDKHCHHHFTRDVWADLNWWQAALSKQAVSQSFLPCLHLDPDVCVNASMSWGIGLVVQGHWVSWQLLEGWKASDHNISWAKMVMMELALLWVVSTRIHGARVIGHGDNMGVLGKLNKGRSHNAASNLSIF